MHLLKGTFKFLNCWMALCCDADLQIHFMSSPYPAAAAVRIKKKKETRIQDFKGTVRHVQTLKDSQRRLYEQTFCYFCNVVTLRLSRIYRYVPYSTFYPSQEEKETDCARWRHVEHLKHKSFSVTLIRRHKNAIVVNKKWPQQSRITAFIGFSPTQHLIFATKK